MNTFIKNISAVTLAIAVLMVGALFVSYHIYQAQASVIVGNEYWAEAYTSADVGTSSLKKLYGSIGSVVISSTSPVAVVGPMLAFYDTASTTVATSSLTAKFTFGGEGAVTPPAGTYTFDAAFANGIMVWVNPAFNGNYTITYR